jgi:hypothetical protein
MKTVGRSPTEAPGRDGRHAADPNAGVRRSSSVSPRPRCGGPTVRPPKAMQAKAVVG